MSTSDADLQNSIGSSTVRHSKEDALSEREFELLLEGATRLRDPYAQQARFVVLVAGRLGLRLGEMTHMREGWVDWRRRMIEIPRHQGCEKGRDGGLCGLCSQQAEQRVKHNDNISIEQAKGVMWAAKTDAAARSVPFDFDPRAEIAIERFFGEWGQWPLSHTAIRRRVAKAAEAAVELDVDGLYPHALRATAATYHAGRGLPVLALKGLMGWVDASTANSYVADSPENTARALHQIHSR